MNEFIYEAIITLCAIQKEELISHEYHIKIFQAIKNRNKTDAMTQMTDHLLDNRKQLMKYYTSLSKMSQHYKNQK